MECISYQVYLGSYVGMASVRTCDLFYDLLNLQKDYTETKFYWKIRRNI